MAGERYALKPTSAAGAAALVPSLTEPPVEFWQRDAGRVATPRGLD